MRHRAFRTFASWICLLSFCVSTALGASGAVLCLDGHGESRVELGCQKAKGGECLAAHDGEPGNQDSGDHKPCEDKPLDSGELKSVTPTRLSDSVPVLVPIVAAILVFVLPSHAEFSPAWQPASPERVPDTICRLRTTILLI